MAQPPVFPTLESTKLHSLLNEIQITQPDTITQFQNDLQQTLLKYRGDLTEQMRTISQFEHTIVKKHAKLNERFRKVADTAEMVNWKLNKKIDQFRIQHDDVSSHWSGSGNTKDGVCEVDGLCGDVMGKLMGLVEVLKEHNDEVEVDVVRFPLLAKVMGLTSENVDDGYSSFDEVDIDVLGYEQSDNDNEHEQNDESSNESVDNKDANDNSETHNEDINDDPIQNIDENDNEQEDIESSDSNEEFLTPNETLDRIQDFTDHHSINSYVSSPLKNWRGPSRKPSRSASIRGSAQSSANSSPLKAIKAPLLFIQKEIDDDNNSINNRNSDSPTLDEDDSKPRSRTNSSEDPLSLIERSISKYKKKQLTYSPSLIMPIPSTVTTTTTATTRENMTTVVQHVDIGSKTKVSDSLKKFI